MNVAVVPMRTVGWIALGVALLTGLLTWNGHRSNALDRQELAAAIASQQKSSAQAALYRRENALLRARVDSLSAERSKRDTVYVVKRDAARPLLEPVPGLSPDSAAGRLAQVQAACSDALNACDAYKAAAEAELSTRRQQAVQDSTRIGQLSTSLEATEAKLLEVLTAEPKEPTFMEKVEKAAKVTLIVLAIIGSFLLGQAAP